MTEIIDYIRILMPFVVGVFIGHYAMDWYLRRKYRNLRNKDKK